MNDESNPLGNRKTSLLKMATKVALKQGKNLVFRAAEKRLQNMVSQADVIVQHVGQLKGAAMKAVQMLTIEGQDFLPPEVLQVLEKLQSQAPPVDSKKMHGEILAELGTEKFSQLKNLSEKPMAAASIGQVYTAEYKGQSVVVKIQYPGVAESVDSDLKLLQKLVQGLLLVNRKKVNIDDVFAELNKILKLETNYLNELKNLQTYGDNFFEIDGYKVPTVVPEMTTKKVITMERVDGLDFTQWVRKDPPLELREKVAHRLIQLYYIEFFRHRLVQTDPNPANFLIHGNGDIVLLDFGATVAYDDEFVSQYKRLLKCLFFEDDKLLEELIAFGFIDARESPEAKQGFVDFLKFSLSPFQKDLQPFDFSDPTYMQSIRSQAMGFMRKIRYSAPPKKIIFLHRKLGGIFLLVRILKVKIDMSQFLGFIESGFDDWPELDPVSGVISQQNKTLD